VRILGTVGAMNAEGAFVGLPSASQRRLLAVLALHAPRRLRSDWLADVLGVSPGALRTTVSRMRATIGAAVERSSSGYVLTVDVDAERFCRAASEAVAADDRVLALGAALDEWSGPALEEFAGEEWARGEIARLTEIHAGTVDDLAASLIAVHRPADAVALLAGQMDRHPFRDSAHGLMIRALAAAGRQADALRAFQRYRSVLIDEVGIDPSPEVVRIERRVATGWDGVESREVARGTDDAVVELPLPGELKTSAAFVGRAGEMRELTRRLSRATTGGVGSVVVAGEAGIGKTALLGAFARDLIASRRATVAYGRCDQAGPTLQALRGVIYGCVEHAPSALLAAHVAQHGGELLRFCPALAQRVDTTPAPTESDEATERFLAFDAAADLIGRVASARPFVVMIDDVQFAAPTTLLLLRHFARALVDKPVLFVLALRMQSDLGSDALHETLADLARSDSGRLDLGGLHAADLADLIRTMEDATAPDTSDSVARSLAHQTAGNPLYASQLIRHWNESGFETASTPASLRDLVRSRVRAVSSDATEVLTSASVLGAEFDEDVLIAMLPLPESTVVATLNAATRAGLLSEGVSTRRSLRFVHALVATALCDGVESSGRTRLHEAAALALQQVLTEPPPDAVVQLARHFSLAGRPEDAQRWSVQAGDDALGQLAPAEAATHYRVALDLALARDRPPAERADLLVRLGDALHRAGDPAALETIAEGSRLAQASAAREPLIRAVFAADRGFMRIDSGAPEYLAMIEHALAVADPTDVATYARLRALLARGLVYTPDAARRLAAAHEALDLAEQLGDPTVFAQVAPAALYALWGLGRRELRQRVAADAIRSASAAGNPRLEFAAHQAAYNVAVESGDPTIAARSLAAMRTIAGAIPEPGLRWTLGIYDTFDTMMAGRLDDAEALATANLELGMPIAPDAFTIFAGQLFVIGTFGGRHEELLPLVKQVVDDNPGPAPFKLAYGIACAATGREAIASEILAEGVANRFGEIAFDHVWLTTILGYAVLAIELADAGAAALLMPIIEPYAGVVAFNGATSQGPVAAYAGKLASLLDRHDAAEEYLVQALDTASAFGWTYHRATTLFALAAARYRRDGALDVQCHAWLAEAAGLCRAGGFRSWLTQVEALASVSPR
jgi:DNA-binding SARP family transcriptional activator/tetratricopeptide (TPR) repeat protein